MADVIARYRKGKMVLQVVKGEYQGKPTISFTLNKRLLKDNKWVNSDFYTITDIQDILSLAHKVCDNYIKYEKVEPKPKEEETSYQEDAPDEEQAEF